MFTIASYQVGFKYGQIPSPRQLGKALAENGVIYLPTSLQQLVVIFRAFFIGATELISHGLSTGSPLDLIRLQVYWWLRYSMH
jgi:hypothetical protein